MSRAPKDGRILRSGVVKAAEIASGLGLGGPEPEVRAPKLTPAQARAKAEGKPLPPSPPDFETTVIAGGRDAWEYLGQPALEAPAGSPDGTPIPIEPAPNRQPERANWDRIDGAALNGPAPEESAAEEMREAAEEAEKIREYARADAKRAKARVAEAMQSGSPEEREAAAEDARATVAFVQRVKDKIGL